MGSEQIMETRWGVRAFVISYRLRPLLRGMTTLDAMKRVSQM